MGFNHIWGEYIDPRNTLCGARGPPGVGLLVTDV